MHGKPNKDPAIKIGCIKIQLELLAIFSYYLLYGLKCSKNRDEMS